MFLSPNKLNFIRRHWLSMFMVCLALGVTGSAKGGTVNAVLEWDASPSEDVIGYNIYFGTAPGDYSFIQEVGNVTTTTLTGLQEGITYCVTATAFNALFIESVRCPEICFTTPAAEPRPPTPQLSWSNPADITYGQPLTSSQLNASANVAGTFVYSPPLGTVLPAGENQALTAQFFPDSSPEAPLAVSALINVRRAPLVLQLGNPSMTYGSSVPSPGLSVMGYVNGETLATSGISGSPTVSTAVTSTSPVGVYPVQISMGTLAARNYSFQLVGGSVTVTPAVLTLRAVDARRTYGAPNPAFTVSASGFVNGETLSTSGVSGRINISSSAQPSSPVGQYPIAIDPGTLTARNYTFQFVNGALTVDPAPLSVRVDNANRFYGAPDPAFTVSYYGFLNGETLASSGVTGSPSFTTVAQPNSPPGSYAIWVGAGSLRARNYAFNLAGGTLTVQRAPLLVKGDDRTRIYGANNPAFSASFSGFVNGETLATSGVSGTPMLNTTALITSGAGVYPITVGLGTLTARNYDFVPVSGALTIQRAPLLVRANNVRRLYGANNPPLTATFSGFVNGETLASSDVRGVPTLTTAVHAASPAGVYAIWTGLGSLTSANYSFNVMGGSLTIDRAPLLVQADDQTRNFGEPNPPWTATYSGFVNGQTLASSGVTGIPFFTTAANELSPPGEYAVVISGGSLAAANYSFEFLPGTLRVVGGQPGGGEGSASASGLLNGIITISISPEGNEGEPGYVHQPQRQSAATVGKHGAPPRLSAGRDPQGNLMLTFSGKTGGQYQLVGSADLATDRWQPVDLSGGGIQIHNAMEVQIRVNMDPAMRFFRLIKVSNSSSSLETQ